MQMHNDRYSRQIPLIGVEGQEKLSKSSVAIVGCGGVGSLLAEQLVRIGVGRIRIIDSDNVELSNLNRGTMLSENDLGRPKAIACAKHLVSINSSVKVEGIIEKLTPDNVEKLLEGFDLVVGATDNILSRLIINEYAVSSNTPWIYASAEEWHGLVMPIIPGKTACMRCVISFTPVRERGGRPITGPVAALVSSLASLIALKILIGEDMESVIYIIDGREGVIVKQPVQRNPECPICVQHRFEFIHGSRRS